MSTVVCPRAESSVLGRFPSYRRGAPRRLSAIVLLGALSIFNAFPPTAFGQIAPPETRPEPPTPPSQLATPKQLTPPAVMNTAPQAVAAPSPGITSHSTVPAQFTPTAPAIPHYTNAPTYTSQPDDHLPSPSDTVPWNGPSDSSAWLADDSHRGFRSAREPKRESTWYTRQDYFHWNERLDGGDFVTEDGLLLTLGYQRRTGIERFRVEAFGGTMTATSDIPLDDGSVDHNQSQTGYMGARVEYDLLWEPVSFPSVTLFAGIGSRFWYRDLRDDITNSGIYLIGYQETWWTFYPYVGGEKRWQPARGWEFYLNGRIGLTPVTWEHVTFNDVTLHPKCGVTGNAETGLRWNHLFVAAYWEGMTWNESNEVRDSWQPMSRMYYAGLKSGWTF